MRKKCCGNCKWFKKSKDKHNTDDCIWAQKNKLPEVIVLTCLCVDNSIGVDSDDDGTDCECFEVKES